MLNEYFFILVLISLAFGLSLLLFLLSFPPITKSYDLEKISPYECGFDPFQDTRSRFDVRFYLVSILFIIFDLEVIFLFPWAVVLGYLDVFSFFAMFVFLTILILGFIYEWAKGALDWE